MEIPLSILQSLIYELNHFIWSEVPPAGKKSHQQQARHLPGRQAGPAQHPHRRTGCPRFHLPSETTQSPFTPLPQPHSPGTAVTPVPLQQAQMTPRFRKALGNWLPILPEQRNPLFSRASRWGTQFSASLGSAPTTVHSAGGPEPSTDLMRGTCHTGDDMKGGDQSSSPQQHQPPPLPAQTPILWSGCPYGDIPFPPTGKGFSQKVEHRTQCPEQGTLEHCSTQRCPR